MPPLSLPALPSGKPTAWEEAIYAFLVEKRSRSGSTRTVESYARMLWPFFRVTAPDQVRSADVLAYAHGIGASGRVPSSTTVGARIACLSSFYRFTIRMGLLAANPCDALERPRTVPSVARGYSADASTESDQSCRASASVGWLDGAGSRRRGIGIYHGLSSPDDVGTVAVPGSGVGDRRLGWRRHCHRATGPRDGSHRHCPLAERGERPPPSSFRPR